MRFHTLGLCLILSLATLITSCTSEPQDGPPTHHVDVSRIPNAVPKRTKFNKFANKPSYVVLGKRYYVRQTLAGYDKKGIASWYGTKFHGRKTSIGEPYDLYAMTAASKTLPIPCYVRVTNLENHRSVIVRVNDRGPFVANRIIDLSYVAAKKLDMLKKGTAQVRVTAIIPHQQLVHVRDHLQNKRYVQIAAFGEYKNAKQLQQAIARQLGKQVRIQNAGHIYRVQIGPLKNVIDSDRMQKQLRRMGYPHAITVIK